MNSAWDSEVLDNLKARREEWRRIFLHAREWAEENATRIRQCIATEIDGYIAIVFSPSSNRFDSSLCEHLTDLDFELAERFKICHCTVHQMPAKSADDLKHLTDAGYAALIWPTHSEQGE